MPPPMPEVSLSDPVVPVTGPVVVSVPVVPPCSSGVGVAPVSVPPGLPAGGGIGLGPRIDYGVRVNDRPVLSLDRRRQKQEK
jgi:hypothetical protein